MFQTIRRITIAITETCLKLIGYGAIIRQYNERRAKFIGTLTKLLPPSTLYVIGGKWSWCKMPDGNMPELTVVVPDIDLVCMLFGPEVGSWHECKHLCRSRRHWEAENKTAALIQTKCDEYGYRFIGIHWGDPIDENSIRLALLQLDESLENGK